MHSKIQASALDVSQLQRLEKYAIETVGIPSVVLMDNAGRAVAQSVARSLKGKKRPRVVVICGTGNNGGDGFVSARYLWAAGMNVKVLVPGSMKDLKHDPRIFYGILNRLKISIVHPKSTDADVLRIVKTSDVIVDALFGIGLNRPLTGLYEKFVTIMNQNPGRIWSVDIPSGLNATTGEVLGACVKATRTVTFTRPKKGFFMNEGPKHTGCLEIVDIGIPKRIL